MFTEMVFNGLGCDWYGTYSEEALRVEFFNIPFPHEGPIPGWYSTKTDTVLVLEDKFQTTGKYSAHVWNTPDGRELVLKGMGQLFGLVNLPTWRR